MLDRAHIILGAWQPDPADGAVRIRPIRDAATGESLGLVRRAKIGKNTWWRFWSMPAPLEICETDDRALMMSIRPSRIANGVWLVRDCDGNDIGRLRGQELLDPWSQPFARRDLNAEGTWTLREFHGRVYATCATTSAGDDLLAFLDAELTNPFVRMLVVGSFLLLRPRPD